MFTDPLPLLGGVDKEIFTAIVIAELDGDSEPELVHGSDRTGSEDTGLGLFAMNLDGSPVPGNWPVILDVDVRSSPAAADLDGDCLDEIVVGTYGPPFTIRIYDNDGTEIGRSSSNFGVISSPAIGDLNRDGELEIVVGTSDGTLKVLKKDGSSFSPAWPVTLPGRSTPLVRGMRNDVDSSPALGDLDGDGFPEIVVLSDHGIVYAYDRNGQPLLGFPFIAPANTFPPGITEALNFASPIIADIDGDGHLDIIAAMSNARVYGLRADGTPLPGFPLVFPPGTQPDARARFGDDILSTPAVGDVDGDGLLELAVAFYSGPEKESRLYVFDLLGSAREHALQWPTFHGNPLRTGYYPGPPTGDSNRDGKVDGKDLMKFLNTWQRLPTMPRFNPIFDFNLDGQTNGIDLPPLLEETR